MVVIFDDGGAGGGAGGNMNNFATVFFFFISLGCLGKCVSVSESVCLFLSIINEQGTHHWQLGRVKVNGTKALKEWDSVQKMMLRKSKRKQISLSGKLMILRMVF